MRKSLINILFAAVLALCLLLGTWWTPHIAHQSYCLFVRVLPARASGQDKLLSCSNVEQSVSVPSDGSVQNTPADVAGWSVYSNSGDVGRVRISFMKSSPEMVFYPRLNGPASRVSVYEILGSNRRLLYAENGSHEWSSIGRRMLLRSECVANGWSEEDFPIDVEIVLEGKGAQLWHKDGVVFFSR